MPTLEDVFLNVAQDDDDETRRFSMKLDMNKESDKTLFEFDYLDKFSSFGKLFVDFKSNFIRRFYLTIRDKKGLIMEIFCPIFLVLIGCIISQVSFFYSTPVFGPNDLPSLGKQTIYYSSLNKSTNTENYFIKNKINITSENLTEFNRYIDDINNNKSLAINKFIETLYNKTKDSESNSDINNENFRGYYGNMLILNEPNEKNENYEFVELVNSGVIQGVPLYTSAFFGTNN